VPIFEDDGDRTHAAWGHPLKGWGQGQKSPPAQEKQFSEDTTFAGSTRELANHSDQKHYFREGTGRRRERNEDCLSCSRNSVRPPLSFSFRRELTQCVQFFLPIAQSSTPLACTRSFLGYLAVGLRCTSHPSGWRSCGPEKCLSPIRTLSAVKADQKIFGSMPCPRGLFSGLVVFSHPVSGSWHGQ
jgi:hypothetical protein